MKNLIFVFFCFLNFELLAYSLDDYSEDFSALDSKEKQLYFSSANQLKCPTCVGLSVLESETPFSLAIKKKIFELVREKKSETEIKDFFIDRYGSWVLRAPPKKGAHLIVWFLPSMFLFLIGSFGFFFLFYRRRKLYRDKTEELFEEELELFRRL